MKKKNNHRGFRGDDNIDLFYQYDIHIPSKTLYIGSTESSDGDEVGINHRSSEYIIKGLKILNREVPKGDPLNIYLNSIGGDYYHGMAIYDAIREVENLGRQVLIIGYGQICSMGSAIMQAGSTRVVQPHCMMMLHYGSIGLGGESKTVIKQAEEEKRVNLDFEQIYFERMKDKNPLLKIRDVRKLMERDTFLTPKEAQKLGLIDVIAGEPIIVDGKEVTIQ